MLLFLFPGYIPFDVCSSSFAIGSDILALTDNWDSTSAGSTITIEAPDAGVSKATITFSATDFADATAAEWVPFYPSTSTFPNADGVVTTAAYWFEVDGGDVVVKLLTSSGISSGGVVVVKLLLEASLVVDT